MGGEKNRNKIWLELIVPFLLVLILSGWIAWVLWRLTTRSNNKELVQLTYGSIPVTILVAVWTITRQILSVFKSVSAQVMGYFTKTDHSAHQGYQHEVISDINFLMDEIGEKPSGMWKFIGWFCASDTVKGTSISKTLGPDKDDIRMIVFVDDLDRCDESVILKVLSAIHLVLASCNINVILGMNEEVLERAMKQQFPESENNKQHELAKKYIGKIVQLPLSLPDTSHKEIKEFLHAQLGMASEESELEVHEEDSGTVTDAPREDETKSEPPVDIICTCDPPHENSERFLSRNCQIFEQFHRLKNCLLPGLVKKNEKSEKNKFKKMPLRFQMILPSYTYEEQEALDELSKEATGSQRLPREWKRFLIYHRVAWHILSQSEKVKEIAGWQKQLVVWVFCCWQWENQMNDIIENWKEHMKLAPPSLRSIVENRHKQKRLREEKEKEKGKGKGKEMMSDEEEEEDEDPEKEIWESLRKTVENVYDVSKEGILSFQKFRFHCKIKHLL